MCVQCTPSGSGGSLGCGGTTPVCGDDEVCRGCERDAECASMTCLPDGACAPDGSVLFVTPDGSAAAICMASEPCNLSRGIALIDGTKVTLHLGEGRYELRTTLTLTTDLRLVGRGAVIDRDAGGTGGTLEITSGASVALDYVTIQGGDGPTVGVGINCTTAKLTGREITVTGNAAAGINSAGCAVALSRARIAVNQGVGIAASGGSLALARSQVIENIGGGVAVTGATYDLENNVVAKNGNPSSLFGGLLIAQIGTRGTHVFDFNTVAHNQSLLGSTPGVTCSVVFTPLAFTNSIVFQNAAGLQIEGANCTWTYSDIGPIPVNGPGNLALDPELVDPAHNNFHLQVSSPLRDAADPAATLAVDLDGEARPQGGGRDMGADEIP